MKAKTVTMIMCMVSAFPRRGHSFASTSSSRLPHSLKRTGARRRHLVHQCSQQDSLSLAENAFDVLARNGRSWKRLKHLVELALGNDSEQVKSVADVGTDHGLLAAALALSGRFDSVVGADASAKALQDGGLALYAEIMEYRQQKQLEVPLSLEFRHGDGLKVLQPGDADVVCIAGMGVNTMLDILSAASVNETGTSLLQDIGCRQLILQPTNPKPRHLMLLYTGLRDRGWQVSDERIEYLASRWYVSTSFMLASDLMLASEKSAELLLPGMKLMDNGEQRNTSTREADIFRAYVDHHCEWLRKDKQVAGSLRGGEEQWLKAFGNTA